MGQSDRSEPIKITAAHRAYVLVTHADGTQTEYPAQIVGDSAIRSLGDVPVGEGDCVEYVIEWEDA